MPSPSQAKNMIVKALRGIVDRPPSSRQVAALWSFFDSKCCYCGTPIERSSRRGHRDHLLSASEGGTNDLSNIVLACSRCNGDLKRDKSWLEILTEVCTEPDVRASREARIREWQARGAKESRLVSPEVQAVIDRTLREFDDAVADIRRLRDGV